MTHLRTYWISCHMMSSCLEAFGFKFQHYFTLIFRSSSKSNFVAFCTKGSQTWDPNLRRVGAFCFHQLPKHIRVANSVSYWFVIDLGSHFDALFDTCFVDLELAAPPNHGRRFASFSRVRRLRSVSTMPFSILHRFFDLFKNLQKCVWSLQFRTFNAFRPSTIFLFPTEIRTLFIFCQDRPESVFRSSWCRFIFYLLIYFGGSTYKFKGISKATLGRTCSHKEV